MSAFVGPYQANRLWYGQGPFQEPIEVRNSHAKRVEHIVGIGCTGRQIQDNLLNFEVSDICSNPVTPTNVMPAGYVDSTVVTRMARVQQPRSQQAYQPASARRAPASAAQTPRTSQHRASSTVSRPQTGTIRISPRSHVPNRDPYPIHQNGQMGSAAAPGNPLQQTLASAPRMMRTQANYQYVPRKFRPPQQQQQYASPPSWFRQSNPMAMSQAQQGMPVQTPYGNMMSAQNNGQLWLGTPQQWQQQSHFPPPGDFEQITPDLTPPEKHGMSSYMPDYSMMSSQWVPQSVPRALQHQQWQNFNADPGNFQHAPPMPNPAVQQGMQTFASDAGMMSWQAAGQSGPGIHQQQPQEDFTIAPDSFQQGSLSSTSAVQQGVPTPVSDEVTVSGQAEEHSELETWEQQIQDLSDVDLNGLDMYNLTAAPQAMQGMPFDSYHSAPPPAQTAQQLAPEMQHQQQSEAAQTTYMPSLLMPDVEIDQSMIPTQMGRYLGVPESQVMTVAGSMDLQAYGIMMDVLYAQQAGWKRQPATGTGTVMQRRQQSRPDAVPPPAMPVPDSVPMPLGFHDEPNATASTQPYPSLQQHPIDLTRDEASGSDQQAGRRRLRDMSRPPPVDQEMSERRASKQSVGIALEQPRPGRASSESSSPSQADDEVPRRRASGLSTMRAMSLAATHGRSRFRRPQQRLTATDLSADDESSEVQEQRPASPQSPESNAVPQPVLQVQRRRAARINTERGVAGAVSPPPPAVIEDQHFEALAARIVGRNHRQAASDDESNGEGHENADDKGELVLEIDGEDLDGPLKVSSPNVAPSSPPERFVSFRNAQYAPDIDYNQRGGFLDEDRAVKSNEAEALEAQEDAAITTQEDAGSEPEDECTANMLAEFETQREADRKKEAAEKRKAKKAVRAKAEKAAREAESAAGETNDSALEDVHEEQSSEDNFEEARGMKM